ncbi:MAG: HAMP domain-containing histidine kinase [Oscillospiraceae bacterium]|nr:HAMP domain-containing histidine kinase [Oscillospiraceae bacterium]
MARYFDPALDLRVQSFNLLGFAGFAAGLVTAVSSVVTDAGAANIALNLAASALALILLRLTEKKRISYHIGSWAVIIAVFMIAFPILFFTAGGYRSGMPCFFMFAIIYTAILLENRERNAALAVESALYAACCLVAYFYPETVTPLGTEFAYVCDVLVGITAASVLLTVVIMLHIRIYNDRQQRLAELDKLKSEFLENVSHELKTPITVTRNYAVDTLRELSKQPLNVPEMEFNQSRIKSESERLERMVSQLLNVTSLEGGRRKLFMEPLSLAALLSRVTETNFNALNENGNALTLEIPEGLPDVAADPDAIEQIVLNLLSNAARHTQNGTIAVSLTAGNGYQTVRVSDSGEGMPQKIQEQVFLRYIERESHVTGRSGMGLYICKKLIDAHGGEIGIDGEPGKGTAVWFAMHNAQCTMHNAQ